jgi:hypothetical protein
VESKDAITRYRATEVAGYVYEIRLRGLNGFQSAKADFVCLAGDLGRTALLKSPATFTKSACAD